MPSLRLSASILTLGFAACSTVEPQLAVDNAGTDRVVRVAVCQTEVGPDIEANFAAIEKALLEALALNADVACFAETSLYGWVNPDAHYFADPIPGTSTIRISALAQQYGLMIAIGLAERDGDKLYDSAILVDRDGNLLLKHRKVNILTELMDPPYTPGDGTPAVVNTRLGRIGMLICADTFKDEVVLPLAEQKPDLVLVPYGWAAPVENWPAHGRSLQSWVSHTARRTSAPVVGVDAIGQIHHGPWTGYVYGGQSVVSAADGGILGVMADRQSQVQVFESPVEPARFPKRRRFC